MNKEYWMKQALKEAEKAFDQDEVPIGCVIVKDDQIIAQSYNKREIEQQSIAHAEILAIQEACKKVGSWRLENCDLYVTLEPCPMCSGAIIQSRIRAVYFGAYDPKGGCAGSCINLFQVQGFNHYPVVEGGILQAECSQILKDYFRWKREEKKKNKAIVEG